MEPMKRRPETDELIEYLESLTPGTMFSLTDLEAHTNWKQKDRHLLQSALRYLQNSGQQFQAIRGYGYEKLKPDNGITHIRRYHNAKVMRDTDRMDRKIHGMNPASMSPYGRKQLEMAQSELLCRQHAEAQFHQATIDEKVARKRLREQERRRKAESAQTMAFLQYAKDNNVG